MKTRQRPHSVLTYLRYPNREIGVRYLPSQREEAVEAVRKKLADGWISEVEAYCLSQEVMKNTWEVVR